MTTEKAPSRWGTRLLAVVLLLFCLIGGFVGGVIMDRIYLIHHQRVLPPGGAEFITRHLVRRLDHSLDLTDQQEQQVRAILERRKMKIQAHWRGLHQSFHQEIEEANAEISALLTPEQRKRFERMRWRWRGKGGP